MTVLYRRSELYDDNWTVSTTAECPMVFNCFSCGANLAFYVTFWFRDRIDLRTSLCWGCALPDEYPLNQFGDGRIDPRGMDNETNDILHQYGKTHERKRALNACFPRTVGVGVPRLVDLALAAVGACGDTMNEWEQLDEDLYVLKRAWNGLVWFNRFVGRTATLRSTARRMRLTGTMGHHCPFTDALNGTYWVEDLYYVNRK